LRAYGKSKYQQDTDRAGTRTEAIVKKGTIARSALNQGQNGTIDPTLPGTWSSLAKRIASGCGGSPTTLVPPPELRTFLARLSKDALPRRYSDYLWNAAYRHHEGIQVGGRPRDPVEYAVFVQPDSGRRAIVIINDGRDIDVTVSVDLAAAGVLTLVTPENHEPRSCNISNIPVKARSAVVLLEGLS
jgi:hypothetical protein